MCAQTQSGVITESSFLWFILFDLLLKWLALNSIPSVKNTKHTIIRQFAKQYFTGRTRNRALLVRQVWPKATVTQSVGPGWLSYPIRTSLNRVVAINLLWKRIYWLDKLTEQISSGLIISCPCVTFIITIVCFYRFYNLLFVEWNGFAKQLF